MWSKFQPKWLTLVDKTGIMVKNNLWSKNQPKQPMLIANKDNKIENVLCCSNGTP